MSLLTNVWRTWNRVEVSTTTEADIEARLNDAPRIDEPLVSAPPAHAVVMPREEPDKADLARAAGMIVVGGQIYDHLGRVHAGKWKQLNRNGEAYVASLPPMKRDPSTGRPVRE